MRRDKKDRKKYHTKEITSTIVCRWIMVFFCSTRFALCYVNFIMDSISSLRNVPGKKRIRFFILAYAMSQAHTCVHLANARGSIPRSSAAGYLILELSGKILLPIAPAVSSPYPPWICFLLALPPFPSLSPVW